MNSKTAAKEKQSDEVKYTLQALREACVKALDCSTAVFDGAMYGVKGDLTLDEAKSLIKSFKNKKLGGK